MFAFDLYDADSSGEIEPREIDRMLRELYGGIAGNPRKRERSPSDHRARDARSA